MLLLFQTLRSSSSLVVYFLFYLSLSFLSIFDCLCLPISKPLAPDVITCYGIILHGYISSWKTQKKRKVEEKIKENCVKRKFKIKEGIGFLCVDIPVPMIPIKNEIFCGYIKEDVVFERSFSTLMTLSSNVTLQAAICGVEDKST